MLASLRRHLAIRLRALRVVVEELGPGRQTLQALNLDRGPADPRLEIGSPDRTEEPDPIALDRSADAGVELPDDGRCWRADRGCRRRLARCARRTVVDVVAV